MSVKIGPCVSAEDFRAAAGAIWHYFGRSTPNDNQIERLARVMPVERMLAARDGERIIGGAGAFPFELTIPGGRLRAAGVSVVGVLPTHRRRGVLNNMMRVQLDDCHARGEAVAYLWASEDGIYGRFGYGLASLTASIDVARERSGYAAAFEADGEPRLVPLGEAEPLVAPVYERVASETPGMFARSSAWWQARVLADPEWLRGRGGELQCVVLESGGRPTAFGLYRVNVGFDRGISVGNVEVVEAMGHSPAAMRGIWRYLLDVDLVSRMTAGLLPVDHPLLLLMAEPRRLRFTLRDGLWVRLVDVSAALSARSYAASGAVTIDVVDAVCTWNQGRWRVGDGGAKRTDDAAELRCDVAALGSVYLGGFTWVQLARALRVEEVRPGAISHADTLFRTDRAPWCSEIF